MQDKAPTEAGEATAANRPDALRPEIPAHDRSDGAGSGCSRAGGRQMRRPMMRRIEALRSFYLLLALFAAATPAMADECDARAADLVRATGATFDRKSSVKIFLKLGGFREFAVECMPALGVDVGVATGLPPDTFFDFVAQTAHIVTGLPAASVKAGAILCHKSALRSGDDMSDLDYKGAQFACQSFTRNGGATSITVFKTR